MFEVSGELVVSVAVSRWDVTLTIRDAEGTECTWKASADSYFTNHDGIWFGTLDEYERALR